MNTFSVLKTLDSELLERWFLACGIGREFIEFSGAINVTSVENRWHILSAMGLAPASAEDLESRLAAYNEQQYAGLPPVVLVNPAAPALGCWLNTEHLSAEVFWELTLEDGELLQGQGLPADWPATGDFHLEPSAVQPQARQQTARTLTLPPLPAGYHRLTLSHHGATWHTVVIAAPERAFQTDKLSHSKRCWGLSVQLYSLRSEQNWGMGDYADLERLLGLTAQQGTDFILLNPLHALDPRYPDNASPYSPGDRRFLNPLYIAPAKCPGFTSEPVQSLCLSESFQQRLSALRATDNVQYSEVSRLKYQVFALLYAWLKQEGEQDLALQQELTGFTQSMGTGLVQYCQFQAEHGEPGTLSADADFQQFLQWLGWRQLQQCQQQAQAAGMSLGLVRDLAVGSTVDGCEVSSNPHQFCLNARIGAPPDNFNPDGQNWGLPPMLPAAMFEDRFRLFRELVASNMSHCGALRIDHVLGYCRLWWCPNDGSNATGAYVHYPVDILFAILRLESHRHGCVVIGEDLGVVPPQIRPYLEQGGIYSNCVFYFEKYDAWNFRKPEQYKWQALTMQANHDVAPLAAWWNASDLHLRFTLGLIPDEEKLQQELDWRRGERGSLLQWLDDQGLLPMSWHSRPLDQALDNDLQLALTRAIARVSSALLSIQVDDLAQVELPVNIPGTSSEYANWRRKLPEDIEAIFARPFVQQMLQEVNEARE